MSATASPAPSNPLTMRERLGAFAADIKLAHTLFAMPFALLGMFLGARHARNGLPTLLQVGLILLCMVLARSFAMGMNRLLDARLDALNPRTAGRAIPAGRLTAGFVLGIVCTCAVLFIAATACFGLAEGNWLPFALSVPALLFVGAYPLLKRFTALCHYYLGAALGLAPLCAWIAVGAPFVWTPVLLGLAVLCWTAGFDVLYAAQDYDSDRRTGVRSVPARLGIRRALGVARLTHAASVAVFILAGIVDAHLAALWFGGVAIALALLIYEHSLVKPHDLSKLDVAFFTLNGIIALCLGALGILDTLL